MKRRECEKIHPLCGRLCNPEDLAHVMTRLELVEGGLLESLETRGNLTLHELMEIMEWEPCVIAMAAGSLIRQGIVKSDERGGDVTLGVIETKKRGRG